jgi:uncharacterized protein with HEPN domain
MKKNDLVYLHHILNSIERIEEYTEGMRDRLIHHYFGVNLKDFWYPVKFDIPVLKNEILAILNFQETEK